MKTQLAPTSRGFSFTLFVAFLVWFGGTATPAVHGQITNGVWGAGTTPYGHSLDEWEIIWGRWNYGQTAIAPDANGNALVNDTVLLPFLNPIGNGQAATMSATLDAGQGFMLPIWGVYGNSYVNGNPDDDFITRSTFATLVIRVTMDGAIIISETNAMDYYSELRLSPPIPFNFFPYDYIISFQDIGMVHAPLPPGRHVLTVHARNTEEFPPNYGGGVFEVNSIWNIMVAPPPSLGLIRQGTNVFLTWPRTFSNYVAEGTSTLNPPGWAPLGLPVQQVGNLNQISLPIAAGSQLFRLRKGI